MTTLFKPLPLGGQSVVSPDGTSIAIVPTEPQTEKDQPGTCIQFYDAGLHDPSVAAVKNICSECRRMMMQWNGVPYPIEYELPANAVGTIQVLGNGSKIIERLQMPVTATGSASSAYCDAGPPTLLTT